jgi:hypothetical protein
MRITRKNCLGLVVLFLLILLVINNLYRIENFSDGLDNIDGMEKKMNQMDEIEQETRMFCKILRHDEDRVQLQDLLNARNKDFQKNWQKQNKIINDIKKKFIKLRLEKDGRNFIDFNDGRNERTGEMDKRKQILNKAKEVAQSPYNLNVNINNSN